ncbi:hypothetical protein B0H14DRAFT_2600774 [Mycena olivaceomarginata]|nr:hypothetical protein B0H14DRAFT_2600774 [Mycena olivaceomarginata]
MFASTLRRQAHTAIATACLPRPALCAFSTSPLTRFASSAAAQIRRSDEGLRILDDPFDDEDFLDFAAKYHAPSGNPLSCRLFMGSISPEVTEEYIRDSAANFGALESVQIMCNPNGSSCGCAYLTFAEQSAADAFLGIWGPILDMDYAAESAEAPPEQVPPEDED